MRDLHDLARRHRRWFVLTGAGISTDSGIPAYRDETGTWRHPAPVTLQDFLRSDHARRRYWARSMAGWPRIARAAPNAAHSALAVLEAEGRVTLLVTQNVDGLHGRAGSHAVIELHGNLARVVCLECACVLPRADLQRTLERDNPFFTSAHAATTPDGDADIGPSCLDDFIVPACEQCGGTLKPDVVFFGERVPPPRVEAALAAMEDADAVVVVGSSLAVYSGYRFCLHAQRLGKPIAAISRGRTRADAMLALKIDRGCTETLSELLAQIEQRRVAEARNNY